jgi:hypothetical protein
VGDPLSPVAAQKLADTHEIAYGPKSSDPLMTVTGGDHDEPL